MPLTTVVRHAADVAAVELHEAGVGARPAARAGEFGDRRNATLANQLVDQPRGGRIVKHQAFVAHQRQTKAP